GRRRGLVAGRVGGGGEEGQDAATAAAPAPVKVAAISRKPAAAPEARSEKPSAVAVAESRVEKVAMVPFPPAKPARPAEQFASAGAKPAAELAPTSQVGSAPSRPAPNPL